VGYIPSSKSTVVYRLSPWDTAVAVIAPIAALWIRNPIAFFSVSVSVITTYVAISVCFSVWFFLWFRIARSLPDHFSIHDAGEVAKATLCAVTSTAAFAFTITRLDQIPRSAPAIHFLTLLAMLLSIRFFHSKLVQNRELRAARAISHDNEKNVIIVGAGTLASLYAGFLESIPRGGWRVAAILDDSKWLHGRSLLGHTIIGGANEAEPLLDDFAQHGLKISSVVICDHDRSRAFDYRDRLEPLCVSRGLPLELLSEKLGIFDPAPAISQFLIDRVTPPNPTYFRVKRVFDLTVAMLALIVFLPAMALTSLLVLMSAGLPVIFWQRRVGRHGRTIFVYKFKTMRNAVDRNGRLLSGSERSTRIGEVLRATRLDELPQLLNVIRGDMGTIGPRPLLPIDQPTRPLLRLAVAPGLTGWAQIHGGKLITVDEKNSLDEWYVQNASVWLDAEILWRTFLTLWGDRRDESRLAAALMRARGDEMRRSVSIPPEPNQNLSALVESNGRRTAR
jgi:lipopolysaccharide/colanic/teichoic acid biosynthesis glycosyltransferase